MKSSRPVILLIQSEIDIPEKVSQRIGAFGEGSEACRDNESKLRIYYFKMSFQSVGKRKGCVRVVPGIKSQSGKVLEESPVGSSQIGAQEIHMSNHSRPENLNTRLGGKSRRIRLFCLSLTLSLRSREAVPEAQTSVKLHTHFVNDEPR
jgi:hypothetical protein